MLRKRLLRMDVVQAEHNVPMSHVQVLTMLGENGVMTVSEISQRLGIAKPNITPLVDRLIADGYVERRRDETDRRVVKVVLLPEGEEQLASIQETIVRHAMRWVGTIPDKDFYELERSPQFHRAHLGAGGAVAPRGGCKAPPLAGGGFFAPFAPRPRAPFSPTAPVAHRAFFFALEGPQKPRYFYPIGLF